MVIMRVVIIHVNLKMVCLIVYSVAGIYSYDAIGTLNLIGIKRDGTYSEIVSQETLNL